MSTITLRLNELTRKRFVSHISSDHYADLVDSVLVPLDLLYTYVFRYNRLLERDMAFDIDANAYPNTQGTLIDYTANTPEIAALVTIGFLVVSAVSLYTNYQRKVATQKRATEACSSSLRILREIEVNNQDKHLSLATFNHMLTARLLEDNALACRYKSIQLSTHLDAFILETQDDDPTTPTLKPSTLTKTQRFILDKIVSPIWKVFYLASFTFWILWIGAGIVTGTFGGGIAGIPLPLVYIIPFGVGLLYPLMKSVHWFKNRNKNLAAEKKAAEDIAELTNRVLFDEYKNQIQKAFTQRFPNQNMPSVLVKQPTYADTSERETLLELKEKIGARLFTTGFAATFGTYICLQYGLWITTDFLSMAFNVADFASLGMFQLVGGIATLAIAGLTGIYRTYQAYSGADGMKETAAKIDQLESDYQRNIDNREADLVQEYKRLCASITRLKNTSPCKTSVPSNLLNDEMFQLAPEKPKTTWERLKPSAYKAFHFINGACSGIFIGRVFFVKASAIVLPFAAVALANPYTIGILAAIGIIYGCVKLYQYIQDEKVKEAKERLANSEKNIKRLQEKIELGTLLEKTLHPESAPENLPYLTVVPKDPRPSNPCNTEEDANDPPNVEQPLRALAMKA